TRAVPSPVAVAAGPYPRSPADSCPVTESFASRRTSRNSSTLIELPRVVRADPSRFKCSKASALILFSLRRGFMKLLGSPIWLRLFVEFGCRSHHWPFIHGHSVVPITFYSHFVP